MDLKNKKAQAAVEQLMVYGIAFVVIVGAIAALIMLLQPGNTGITCTQPNALLITNQAATAETFSFVVLNTTGRDIQDMNITVSNEITNLQAGIIMKTNAKQTFTFTGVMQGSFIIDAAFEYRDEDGIMHSDSMHCQGSL
jgi:hypothetical protein